MKRDTSGATPGKPLTGWEATILDPALLLQHVPFGRESSDADELDSPAQVIPSPIFRPFFSLVKESPLRVRKMAERRTGILREQYEWRNRETSPTRHSKRKWNPSRRSVVLDEAIENRTLMEGGE